MEKKILSIILAMMLVIVMAFAVVACNNNTESDGKNPPVTDSEGTSGGSSGGASGGSSGTTENKEERLPTKAEIVAARQKAIAETVQGYDFTLDFKGNFSVLGIGSSLGGKYDGAYRYDGATDTVSFKRTTSGALLFDSTAYIVTSGDSLIKMTMDGNNIKKVSVEVPEEKDITMVNLPIVSIVDSIGESNIKSVSALKNSNYKYTCQLTFDEASVASKALNFAFEKLGTGVSFKGIKLNADSGKLDFNITDGKINDFRFGFQMEVDVKNVKVGLDVEYNQKGSSAKISVPSAANDIMYTASDLQREVSAINAAIEDLKDDPIYSLDLTAKNEFDPGWNKLAITDSYKARMYKNTDEDDNVWFNHSYCFKAHSEEDGKESYKFTLGNVNGKDEDNQGTWLISRKSTNTQTKVENVTADSQFDFLTSMVKLSLAEVDCIKKVASGTNTVYTVYLGRTGTASVQKKIVDMINTNNYGDVIAVNNYFSADNIVKDAEIEIVLTDGKIASVKCKTKLCYTPTGGDYTEYNITLDNNIELLVNKNIDKATKYKAPTKVKGTLGIGNNLNDSSNYIL